jgi:RNA polymerase sigma factor (sigma-70 family)
MLHQSASLIRCIRKMVGVPVSDLSDQQLLQQFIEQHDEAAFEVLLDRHGPLVRSVCLRILGNPADADDAFQATFLVLARQAGSVRKQNSLAAWLYAVAGRIAAKARLSAARRREYEKQAAEPAPGPTTDEMTWRELMQAVDEEIAALPEKYRLPLILCCLQGKSRDEAAEELRWTVGSVKGRLERGRELLRNRLARRGLTLSATLFAVVFANGPAGAAVPPLLVAATTKAAVQLAAGHAVSGLVSAQTVGLVADFVRASSVAKLKFVAAVAALLLTITGTGVGAVFGLLAGQAPHAAQTAPAGGSAAALLPEPAGAALAVQDPSPPAELLPPPSEQLAADLQRKPADGEPLPPPRASAVSIRAVSGPGGSRSTVIITSSTGKSTERRIEVPAGKPAGQAPPK